LDFHFGAFFDFVYWNWFRRTMEPVAELAFPEQALGYAQAPSDVFSLAKVVIELLCGVRVAALLQNAALDLPERVPGLLKKVGIELSAESVGMLARALEFDPQKRPGAASEFVRGIVLDLATRGY
jgi:hypothetical protein